MRDSMNLETTLHIIYSTFVILEVYYSHREYAYLWLQHSILPQYFSKNEDLCMKNESVSQILNPLGSNESENQTWGMMHLLLALI